MTKPDVTAGESSINIDLVKSLLPAIIRQIPTWPEVDKKKIDEVLNKYSYLTEDQKKMLREQVESIAKENLRLFSKMMVWIPRVEWMLCGVLTIYMAGFFILLLGCSLLALAPTVTAAVYWIYLVHVTRLNFLEYIAALVKHIFLVFVPVKTSKHRQGWEFIFVLIAVLILFVLISAFPESLHPLWAWFLAVGGFLYVLLLLIPQLYHSWKLSKPVYSAQMANFLEKRSDVVPLDLSKSAAQGFELGAGLSKGEPKSVSEDVRAVTSADTVKRRCYTNLLVPYLPAHAFIFGLIAYAVTQRVSFATTGFPIGDFTVTAQLFLVIASVIIPFIAFVDFPFWLGQKEWKIENLGQLRAKLTRIKEKIEKTSEGDKENRDQFECALKMHKFYQEEIDEVTKIPMHPYNFQVSLGVFVLGLISSSISQFVGSLLSP